MPISVASPRSLAGTAAPLRALVRAALAGEGRSAGEVGIVLARDATVRVLNRRWRRIDRATDVLSFDYGQGGGRGGGAAARRPARVSGDVVVSLDRMREQARRCRVSEGEELARLVVHGALHLAGLDHRRPPERRLMRAREARVLRAGRAAVARLARALRRCRDGSRRCSPRAVRPARRRQRPRRRPVRTPGRTH